MKSALGKYVRDYLSKLHEFDLKQFLYLRGKSGTMWLQYGMIH